MEEIKVNLDNLTNEERETLLKLVEKGNRQVKRRWRGGENDTYYSVSNCGDITSDYEYGCAYDKQSYRLGNYFKTEEEAVFARERQLVYQQLSDYALEHNTELIDWNNYNQLKWCINYAYAHEELKYCWSGFTRDINQIYFTSEEIAKAAVKEIGEDNIKKYLFGVGE